MLKIVKFSCLNEKPISMEFGTQQQIWKLVTVM